MAVRYSDGPGGLQIDPDGPYNLAHTHAMHHGIQFQNLVGPKGELTAAFDRKGRPYATPWHPRNEVVTIRPLTKDCKVAPWHGEWWKRASRARK